MQIVIATQSLAGLGGSEMYAITIADHLQRLGHDVWVHALDHGPASEHAQSLGVRVAAGAHELPDRPDAVIVQDGAVAGELATAYPLTPQVFVAHSDIFDLQLPPQLPGLIAAVVALYDRVEHRVRALGLEVPVVRLSQPIDVERFKPTSPLRKRAEVALTLGNYVHGQRLALLRRACERASIELRHIGVHGDEPVAEPREAINSADIVFGKARVIYEAMACGRAAYVFDHNGAEGWVTAENQVALSADNFGGQSRPIAVDEDRLVADLRRYDPAMATVNRDFIVAHHSATKHAAALVEVLRGAVPRAQPLDDAPLRELSRLVRLYHRADVQAFALHAHAERLSARVHALESEVRAVREQSEAEAAARSGAEEDAVRARAEAAAARRDAEEARRDAEEARRGADEARAQRVEADERASKQFAALVATRRWRAVQLALRPADRARSAVKRRGSRARDVKEGSR
jgi:hypothetical protein